jgi:hypothetical protein
VGVLPLLSSRALCRRLKGWGEDDYIRDKLVTTNFDEFAGVEAVVFHWIGESPQLSLRCEECQLVP